MNGEHQPICGWCNDAILTIKHLMLDCAALERQRRVTLQFPLSQPRTIASILGGTSGPEESSKFYRAFEFAREHIEINDCSEV